MSENQKENGKSSKGKGILRKVWGVAFRNRFTTAIAAALIFWTVSWAFNQSELPGLKYMVGKWDQVRRLSSELGKTKERLAEVERKKSISDDLNPDFKGIKHLVLKNSNVNLILPSSMPEVMTPLVVSLIQWAGEEGFDTLLLGRVNLYLDGRIVWSDFQGDHITSLNSIFNGLSNIKAKKVLAVVDNPLGLVLPRPVEFCTLGSLKIGTEKPKLAWAIPNPFSKDRVTLTSENFEGWVNSEKEYSFKKVWAEDWVVPKELRPDPKVYSDPEQKQPSPFSPKGIERGLEKGLQKFKDSLGVYQAI